MVQRANSTCHTHWTYDPLLLTIPQRWHLDAETCRSWCLICVFYDVLLYRARQRIGRFLSVKKLKVLDIMIQLHL